MQNFDGLAVLLCNCPGLKHLIGHEGFIFHVEGKHDGVLHCIVCEGNKIFLALVCNDGGWPPYIDMYKVSKV